MRESECALHFGMVGGMLVSGVAVLMAHHFGFPWWHLWSIFTAVYAVLTAIGIVQWLRSND